MKQLNQRDAIHYIATRQAFKASALSGEYKNYTPDTGRLNDTDSLKLGGAMNENGGAFIVRSYGTPIAWFTLLEGWYIVEQKFSVTTSKHQNYVRRAIAESLQGAN
jgi:hypothetical protein